MNFRLKHIGVVVFIGLLLVKTFAFHVHHHDHTDGEHESPCELCLLLIVSQQSDSLTFTFDYIQEKYILPNDQIKIVSTDHQVVLGPLTTYLFSRPPPHLLS